MQFQESPRLFTALSVPAPIRAMLKASQAKLGAQPEQLSELRLILPDQFHITLNFLGQTRDANLSELSSCFEEIALTASALQLSLRPELSLLERPEQASSIVSMVDGPDLSRLMRLQLTLAEGFEALGIAKEARAYSPHISLARLKREHSAVWLKPGSFEETRCLTDEARFSATKLRLYQSVLTANGGIYKILKEINLSKAGRA